MADIKSLIDRFNIFRTKDSILNDVAKDNGQITIDIKQPFSDDIDSNNSLKTRLETNIKDKLFNTEINNVGSNVFDEKIKPFDKGYNVSNTPDTDTKTPIYTTPIKPDTPTIEKNSADATAIQQEKTQQPEITTPKPKQPQQQYKTITEQQKPKLTTDSLGNYMPIDYDKRKGTSYSGVGQQQIDEIFNLIKNDEEKLNMFQSYLSEAYNQLKSANLNDNENIIYLPFSYDHENGNMQGITLRFGIDKKEWAEKQLKILEKGITDKQNEEWLSNLKLPEPETTMDKITSNPWSKLLTFATFEETPGMDPVNKSMMDEGQKENRLNSIKWDLVKNIKECQKILDKYYGDKSQVGTAFSEDNIAETVYNILLPQIDVFKNAEIASILTDWKKNPKSLTPIENEIVKYSEMLVRALSVIDSKTTTGYKTAKSILKSLPFAADFFRANLIGNVTRGGTRAAMNLLGKSTARQIAKNAPKTLGARAFQFGSDIGKAAVQTTLSPLTHQNMLEDYSQTIAANGQYTKKDLRRGVIEAFTENFSERMFGALKGIMPKSNNAFVNSLFGNNPVIKSMQKHMNVGGMFEETAEEYAGAFLNTMFGFALNDEKLTSSFKEQLDNSVTTILSIGITSGLPQAIGMGIDFREIRNTNNRFNVAENNLKQYFNKENSYLDINRYSDGLKSLYINLNNAKNEEDKAEIKGKIAELNKTAANLAMEKGDSNGFNLISEYSIAAQNSFYVTNKAMSQLKDMSEEDRTKLSDNAINKLKNDFTNNLNWSLISRAAAKNITDQNGKQHPTCFLYTDNGVTYVLNGQKDNMFSFVDVNGNTISKSADELRNNENLSVLHLNNLLSSFSNKELEDINSKFIDIAQYNAGYRYKVNDNGEIKYYTDNKELINSNTPYEEINRDKIESNLVGSYDLVRIDNITNAVEDMAKAFTEPAAEETSEQQPAQQPAQETAQETIEQPAEEQPQEPVQEQPIQEQTTEEQETTEQEPIQPTQQEIEPAQQEQPTQQEDDSTALNGVPDIVDDTPQDARERGFRRVNGYKIDRQKPLQAVNGKEIAVRFSNDVIANGHVAVIDAEQLQPSHIQGVRNPLHFIDEAQPKERNDEASIVSAQRIAKNIRPEEITSSVTAYTGAPIINARGETIQGNNRSDALRLMWSQNKDQAEKYKQYLIDHAQEFGLNAEDIAAMERPILVNMIDVSDEDAIALGQYVAQDTESGGLERIKPKNAVQKMGADMRTFANLLLSSNDDEISFAGLIDKNGVDVLNWLGQKGYITPTQYKSAFDTKGYITAEAKNDLRGIMYQSIFQGGSTRLEEMFNTMPAKAQKAILATAFRDYDSPKSESMIVEIQNSIRAYYALSQSADFMNAKTYKDVRLAVEGWKKQYQIDDATGESYLPAENFSNFALLLAAMYKGEKQTLIQGTFNKLYDLIQGTQEADLFETPDNTPLTLSQAIKEVLNIDYNGQQRSNVLVGDTATSQRGEQGSTRDAATRERTKDGERTTDSAGSIEAESRIAQNEQVNTESQGKKPTETTKIEKIKDVGEKIGGSRKDAASEYKRRAEEDLAKPKSELEEFIANTPISKIFNFDLKKLREQGISNEVVSFIKICKQAIPAKPRNAYKRKIWVSSALAIYQMCLYANTKWDRIKATLEKDGGIVKDIYQAYMSVGGFDGGLELNGAALHQLGKEASVYRNGKRISLEGKWRLENAGFYDDIYDTKEEAIEYLKKFAGKNAVKPKSKQIEFTVYQRRADNTLFITPKGKSNIIIQDGFKSSKEAFDYIEEHKSEMEERYKTLMSDTNVEFGENRERKGRDYRGGKDISAQEFMETFGFRGVEFGNWTNQKDRQVAINNAYDAFMDLAEVLGVSPKALSLNGKLGMAFGARGRGKFNAHYERDKVVINLTKTKGAGSLAHEWFHALDHYFATLGKADSMEFATNLHLLPKGVYRYIDKQGNYKYHNSRGDELSEEEVIKAFEANGVRREMVEAWYYLMDKIRKSDYYKRSEKYSILHTNYWIDPTELGARAFSKWVENELSKRNATNDYLANNPALFADKVGEIGREYTPYPFDTDAEWIEDAFGNLFQTMEQKTDEETGNVILYQKSDGTIDVLSREEAALRDALIDKVREAGIDVITDVEEAQRVLDDANGKDVRQQKTTIDAVIEARDKEYLEAVRNGDLDKAQRMVVEAAKLKGYNSGSQYQGTSAFNGAAPWGNGYFLTKEERKEAWDNDEYDGDQTLGDYIHRGIDANNLDFIALDPRNYRAADPMRKEAIDNVRNAIQKKSETITMYRSVPSDVKEGSFRNGDWVTPSRAYAVENAKVHGWGDNFNIIEQKVPVDEIWWDGNDIAEWGYGREEDFVKDKDFAYKNTKNNRKLLDAVTYDDNGNVIPLSKRFNARKSDIRFFRTADGNAYGFTVAGKIYIDPRIATADTPIHEYAHLWASAMQKLNPNEWANIVDMMKGTPIWEEVKRNYPELTTDNEIADEVLAFYSGSRGAERLREEHIKILKENGNVVEKVKAINAIKRVREALKRFWKNVADWFGIHFTTAEEVADKVLSDLLNGVNHTLAGIENDIRFEENSEEADIVARAKADGTYMKAPNGKQSNLSPRQWVQVRTKAFKDWFGDWENDPDNSSKVVDENGEPRVMWHETGNEFSIFEPRKFGAGASDYITPFGIFLKYSPNPIGVARGGDEKQMALYVNMHNPIEFANREEMEDYLRSNCVGYAQAADRIKNIDAEYGKKIEAAEKAEDDAMIDIYSNNPDIWNDDEKRIEAVEKYSSEVDSILKEWKDTEGRLAAELKETTDQFFRSMGHDGVVLKIDEGSFGRKTKTIIAFIPNQVKSATDNVGTFDQNNPDIRYQFVGEKGAANDDTETIDANSKSDTLYRIVDDKSTIERLDAEPKIKAYRAMQVIDGRLYSPMAAKIDGKLSSDNPFDTWTEAEETVFDFTPEQISAMEELDNSSKKGEVEIIKGKLRYRKDSKTGKGKLQFHLVKGDGTDLWAAYNPYIHNSLMMLNDQFTSAYKRPNIVVVEVEIPESELTSGYRANLAKDAVGIAEWKAGPVASQLPSDMSRKVILSRWSKVKRIVPYSEVADNVAALFSTAEQKNGKKMRLPIDSFHPELRKELEKRGFEFEYGTYTKEKTDKKGNLIKAWDEKTEEEKQQDYNGAAYIDDAAIKQLNDEFGGKWIRREGVSTNDELSQSERQRMAERINELAEKLQLDNVEVVTDASTLEGNKKKAKGFYSKSTDKITIVIPNNSSVLDVEQTLLHEAVAHYGLRQLFGEHFDTFLDNVFNNADNGIRKRIIAIAAKNGFDLRTATEEYLATLAENTEFETAQRTGWWQKIKDLFLNMLHRIGFEDFGRVTLTDNELRYILWRSYENLANGNHSILGDATDEAKQKELGVGNYSATNKNSTTTNKNDIRYRKASNRSVISSRFERQAEIQREEKNTKSAANIVLGNANVVLNDTDIFDEQYENAIDNNLIDENVSPLIDSFGITWGYQLKNGVIVINKDVFISDILDKRVKDNLSLLISSLMKTNKTFFKEGISFFKKLPIWVLYKNDTKSNEDTIKEIINDILLGNTSIDTNKLELLKQYTVQDMNDILDNATKWFEKFEGISSNMFAGNSISDILDTTLGDLMPKEITTTQEGKRLNWFSKLGIDIRSKLFDSLDWFRVISDKTKDKTASELYDAMIVHTKRVQGRIDVFDKEYVRPIIDTIQSMLGKDFGNSTLSLDLIQEYFAIKSLLGRTASLYKEKFEAYLTNAESKKPPMFDEFKQIYDEITEDEIRQRINEMGRKSSMSILQKVDIDYLMEEVRRTLAAEMFVKQYVYSSANTLNQGLQGEQSLGLINEVTNEPYSELYQLLYSDEQSSQTMHSPIEIIEQADILIDRAGLREQFDFIGNQIQAILNYVNIERVENGLMSSDTFAKRQLMKDFVNQRGENSSEGNLYEITAKQKANEKMKGKDWFNPNSITSIIAVAQTEIATMEKELLAQRLSYFLTNPNNFDVLSQYGMIIDEKETLNEELSEDERNYITDKNIVLLYGDRHTDKNTKGQVDKKKINILKRNDDGTFTKVTISFDNKFIGLEEFVKFVNNNFKYEELRGLSKAVTPITAWFSRMYTILSPLFPTKNLFKDLMVTPWLPAKELNGKNSQYAIKNFYNAFNNLSFILKMSFTEKSFSKKGFENKLKARSQELFEYYLEYSKQHSIFSIEDQIGALSKENKTLQDIERALSSKENKFIKFTERALLIKFMQHYAEVFENLHKFSAYVTLRKLGYGEERSAQIANNATLNYDRSGSIGRQLNAIIPFAKAALGGLYRTNYLLPKYNPKGFLQRVITLAVLGVMQGLMYDPDDDDISEFARKSGMVFGSFLYPLLPEELAIVRPVRALVIVMAGKKSPAYFKQELMESTIDLVPIASDALRGAFSYNPLTNKPEFDAGQLLANTDKMTAVYALAMLAFYINENKNSFGKNVLLNEETNTDKTRYGRTKQDYGLYDYIARLYNSIINGVDIDDRAAMSNKIGKNGERLMTIAKEDVEFVINNYIPFGRLYAYTAEIIYDAVNDKRINKGHIPLIGGLFAQKSFGKDYYLVNNIKYELKDFTNDFSQSQIEDIKTNILDKAGIREGIRYKDLKDNNAPSIMLDKAKRQMNEAYNVFILDINNVDKKDFTEDEQKFMLKSFLDSPIMKKALSIGEDTLNRNTAKRVERTYKRYKKYNNENYDADKENMKDAVKNYKNMLYDKSITEEEFNDKLNSLYEPMTQQIILRAKLAGFSINL